MEWVAAISQLIGHVAWPATLVAFFVMFRHEIRQRLTAVTEVKYPGGSIVMRDVERLEAKVEEVAVVKARQLPAGPATRSLPAPHVDARLAIAQMRLDIERELFLVSRYALHRADITGWPVDRYIEELEATQVLDSALSDSLRDFVAVANTILHEATVAEPLAQRASAVGSSLVATLRHKRLVVAAESDFWSHGLWHMHGQLADPEKRYYFWSAVAASLPEFDFDYDVYREAADRHNQRATRELDEGHSIYVLSLDEFVAVLEYRERELLRIINVWRGGKAWGEGDRELEWQWPSEWGNISWSGPILRERAYLWGAEEDLLRTRAAITHYRRQLRLETRGEAPTPGAPDNNEMHLTRSAPSRDRGPRR